MAGNYISSPNNPPGDQSDLAGSGGNSGVPYDTVAGLPAPDGGIIPFKNLDKIKGAEDAD